jgi:hypothetical protein
MATVSTIEMKRSLRRGFGRRFERSDSPGTITMTVGPWSGAAITISRCSESFRHSSGDSLCPLSILRENRKVRPGDSQPRRHKVTTTEERQVFSTSLLTERTISGLKISDMANALLPASLMGAPRCQHFEPSTKMNRSW